MTSEAVEVDGGSDPYGTAYAAKLVLTRLAELGIDIPDDIRVPLNEWSDFDRLFIWVADNADPELIRRLLDGASPETPERLVDFKSVWAFGWRATRRNASKMS